MFYVLFLFCECPVSERVCLREEWLGRKEKGSGWRVCEGCVHGRYFPGSENCFLRPTDEGIASEKLSESPAGVWPGQGWVHTSLCFFFFF